MPKAEELVATPYRHGSREAAEAFFLAGMGRAMRRLAEQTHPGFPVTIYYAFKQSERKGDADTSSTGWETFLDAVIRSGFAITGTWPMRTELGNRMIGMGTNALASSIVLVCRRRPADAPAATRRECVTALRAELPPALRLLQTGNVAPVDLAQAAIGPGMAVYTRYAGLPRSGSGRSRAARPRRRRACPRPCVAGCAVRPPTHRAHDTDVLDAVGGGIVRVALKDDEGDQVDQIAGDDLGDLAITRHDHETLRPAMWRLRPVEDRPRAGLAVPRVDGLQRS